MAQIKNTFLKGKMNQDLDSRILPEGEYREAINLLISRSEGNTVGEFKLFTNKGAGLATITPAPFANGSAIRLPQNTATQCIWDGTNWFMLSGNDSANSILIT